MKCINICTTIVYDIYSILYIKHITWLQIIFYNIYLDTHTHTVFSGTLQGTPNRWEGVVLSNLLVFFHTTRVRISISYAHAQTLNQTGVFTYICPETNEHSDLPVHWYWFVPVCSLHLRYGSDTVLLFRIPSNPQKFSREKKRIQIRRPTFVVQIQDVSWPWAWPGGMCSLHALPSADSNLLRQCVGEARENIKNSLKPVKLT